MLKGEHSAKLEVCQILSEGGHMLSWASYDSTVQSVNTDRLQNFVQKSVYTEANIYILGISS